MTAGLRPFLLSSGAANFTKVESLPEYRRAHSRLRGRVLLAALLAIGPSAAAGALAGALAARGLGIGEALPVLGAVAIALLVDARRVPLGLRSVDRKLGLACRLVTADEVLGSGRDLPAEGLLLRDAARRLSTPRLRLFLPERAGPACRIFLLSAAVLLALGPLSREGGPASPAAPSVGLAAPGTGAGSETSESERGHARGGPAHPGAPHPRREIREGVASSLPAEEPPAPDAARMPRLVPIEPGEGPSETREALVFEFPDAVAPGGEVVRQATLEAEIEGAAERARAWARRAHVVPAEAAFVAAYFQALRP